MGTDHARLDRNGLLVLDEETCWTLLARAAVGRLAFIAHGRPEIRPMNHLVDERRLLLASRPGDTLEAALSGPGREVVYEVDDVDPSSGGSSVILRGRLQPVMDAVAARALDRLGSPAWVRAGQDDRWLQLEPISVSGRRLQRSSLPDDE